MPYAATYLIALIVANLAVAKIGPAAMPAIAFALIGLDLTLRDRLHDLWAGRNLWPRMLGLIAAAGILSYALNPASGQIAVASVLAFTLASLADTLAYQVLHRHSWAARVNGSNFVGAVVDSLIFPMVAFGVVPASIVCAQMVAKVAGGALWALVLVLISRKSRLA